MGNFKTLTVWHDAMDLTVHIYQAIRSNAEFTKDFGLKGQITRAAISVPSNISEGDERGTTRQTVYFFHVAKASCAEVITQLNLAHRLGYIDAETLAYTENQAEKVRATLKNLIKARTGGSTLKLTIFLFIGMLQAGHWAIVR